MSRSSLKYDALEHLAGWVEADRADNSACGAQYNLRIRYTAARLRPLNRSSRMGSPADAITDAMALRDAFAAILLADCLRYALHSGVSLPGVLQALQQTPALPVSGEERRTEIDTALARLEAGPADGLASLNAAAVVVSRLLPKVDLTTRGKLHELLLEHCHPRVLVANVVDFSAFLTVGAIALGLHACFMYGASLLAQASAPRVVLAGFGFLIGAMTTSPLKTYSMKALGRWWAHHLLIVDSRRASK